MKQHWILKTKGHSVLPKTFAFGSLGEGHGFPIVIIWGAWRQTYLGAEEPNSATVCWGKVPVPSPMLIWSSTPSRAVVQLWDQAVRRRRSAEARALRKRNGPRMCAPKWNQLIHTSAKEVERHWNRLLREAVNAPSLELFIATLDGVLRNLG